MKTELLNTLNEVTAKILSAKSGKQLHTTVVTAMMKVLDAPYGKLFLTRKDSLYKEYTSSERVKRSTLIKHKQFKIRVQSKDIFIVSREQIITWNIKNFPEEVQTVVAVPLVQNQMCLGVILLYLDTIKKQLTKEEDNVLRILSSTITLALSKAKLQEESSRALEIRDRFISLASHELRTPLTSIHGYIQLLHARMAKNDSIEARWVKELHIESTRMTTLIKELLDVNRIKQGQFAFVFSEVPLQKVIAKAIDRYRLTNANHPFEFQTKLKEDETIVVGDFDKLVEMVSGLLGNAVKFSKPGEKISISLNNDQGMVSMVVKDTGKGISKHDLDAIFEGFYKSDQTSHIEGMGVGLLLARHIVDNHRGKLKITSKENKGTTVAVNLPSIKHL